jgi:predicted ribosome quality control (RQC) complex YloA/Tae2 family protein
VDGYELWVGETAEANDYLVTRAASPTDLWLHVRAGVGAHGILRTQGQPTRVGDLTVRRAAGIVAARSGKSAKHTDLVAVDVTEKRYVRKPRGAKPGLVTYERERTLDVSPAL